MEPHETAGNSQGLYEVDWMSWGAIGEGGMAYSQEVLDAADRRHQEAQEPSRRAWVLCQHKILTQRFYVGAHWEGDNYVRAELLSEFTYWKWTAKSALPKA